MISLVNRWLAWLLAASALACQVRADDGPVKLEVVPSSVSLSPGGTATIRVSVRIDPPFHIYTPDGQVGADGSGPTPTQLTVKTKDVMVLEGALKSSPPAKHYDTNFGMEVSTLEGDAWIETSIRAGASVKPGRHPVVLSVSYQACNDTTCLMPRNAEASFTVEIAAGPESGAGGR
jgi:hypothetical protein